jgi:Xaa-Pro dipeptidase
MKNDKGSMPALFPSPNLLRMRQDRQLKLAAEMQRYQTDVLLLVGTSNVRYATGARWMNSDAGRAYAAPVVAIIPSDGRPHLFTEYSDGVPAELPADQVHGPLCPDFAEGIPRLASAIADIAGRGALHIAVDDLSAAANDAIPRLLPDATIVDAGPILAAAKLVKTDDELACIQHAQSINEQAMHDLRNSLTPGVRQSELTGRFLRKIFELGATANMIDPIWQRTALSIAEGPFTVTGDMAFPIPSTDRILQDGDLIFVDTGISYEGYCSDFGRTWLVGDRQPTVRQRDQFKQWSEIVERVLAICRPGTTGADLVQAACRTRTGHRPWLHHLYLAHGLGTDSAEMPFIGSDLGNEFDESIVLMPGMVLVLEPVIWEDGYGGYRSEDIFAITDDGYRCLSNFDYEPYEGRNEQW